MKTDIRFYDYLQVVGTVLLFLISMGSLWGETAGQRGKVMLKNVKVIKGGHCESSAIVNALNDQGYPVTEPMVAGGGGAPGFTLTSNTFLIQKKTRGAIRKKIYPLHRGPKIMMMLLMLIY